MPRDPASAAFAAGRIVHYRLRELMGCGENFAFETTLSGKSYRRLLGELRGAGYSISLLFLWLRSAELAVNRVAERVREGGHPIAEEDIRRRYDAGLRNFFEFYQDCFDEWKIIDNSSNKGPTLIAQKDNDYICIQNAEIWTQLKKNYGGNEWHE